MACPSCAAFAANPHSGLYHAACADCAVRAIAGSPQHFEAARAGRITDEYRALLERVFGQHWQDGHARVKAAWQSKRGMQ